MLLRNLNKPLILFYNFLGIRLFLLVFLMSIAVSLETVGLSFFIPILQGMGSENKINNVLKQLFMFLHLEYTLLNILIAIVTIITLRSLFLIIQASYAGKITAEMLVDLRKELIHKIFQLRYVGYLNKSSGYINNAVVVECDKVVFSFKMFASLIVSTLYTIAYIAIPLFINPLIVAILVLGGIFLLPVIVKINSLTKKYSILTSSHSSGLQQILIQALNNFKYLKATATHEQVLKHIDAQSKDLGRQQYRLSILGAISQFGFDPLVALAIGGSIFYFIVVRGGAAIECFFSSVSFDDCYGKISWHAAKF